MSQPQVLFLAPDTHVYNHGFVRGLGQVGAVVYGLGPGPEDKLRPGLRGMLAGYRQCEQILDGAALERVARDLGAGLHFDRIETIDEPLVEPAARLRELFGVPGLSVATARLCRDKVEMKAFLRAHDVPCARSGAVSSAAELHAFAEEAGYPLIVKPVDGFNALGTHRIEDRAGLEALLPELALTGTKRIAVEEFVEGHEGFYDTLIGPEGLRHDFAAHYFPGCLEANRTRWISPQIVVTNRIEGGGYDELRTVGRRVIEALGLRSCATHMEWFFGPKGLKFSEIGARPAGEKIWDMYREGDDFDVYAEWARAILGQPSVARPSRRRAVGSIQIRPERDGQFLGHTGVLATFDRYGSWIYEHELPPAGSRTQGLDRGWLCNTWFRLAHPDYDTLRGALDDIGRTVKSQAR
jgi:formate-dependent phosphoribosylglycinamide formyltransferase (GAR transformylase)